ncbi:MAG TPA: hypothetical protein DCG06_08620 [Deltaproteobacteria bacterium]|nr:hypothetical protein [Deltaproteobacteria bacterium]
MVGVQFQYEVELPLQRRQLHSSEGQSLHLGEPPACGEVQEMSVCALGEKLDRSLRMTLRSKIRFTLLGRGLGILGLVQPLACQAQLTIAFGLVALRSLRGRWWRLRLGHGDFCPEREQSCDGHSADPQASIFQRVHFPR